MTTERTRTERAQVLLDALGATPVACAFQDADLKYRWAHNADTVFRRPDVTGLADAELFPAAAVVAMTQAKQSVLQSGKPARLELPLAGDDGLRHYDLYLNPDCDGAGNVRGVVSIFIEVTASWRSVETMHILLRELSHRSKNLLAIVQSLASQTARTASSTEMFVERFNGRIQSVSRSQDLITDTDWRGARIRDLLQTQVGPYAVDAATQLEFVGRNVYLRPNAALYVGLAMHELAVNAAKFGAFSRTEGRVKITTDILDGGSAPDEEGMLLLSWEELGGPPAPEPHDVAEFGHALLARLVPAAVGGRAGRQFSETGLRYDVTLAKDEFE